MKFPHPDFGYNPDFDYKQPDEDYEGTGWRRFMSCISANPKNERVLNYINYVNQVKIQKLIDLTNKKLHQKQRIQVDPSNIRSQMKQLRNAEIYSQLKEGGQVSQDARIQLSKEEANLLDLKQGLREIQK
jgi:hypothetical protein